MTVRKLNKKQMRYLELLLDPSIQWTKEEYAREVGVSRSTLWKWETENDLFSHLEKEGMDTIRRHLGGIYTRLTHDALNGDKRASEQLFKYVLKMDQTTIHHTGDLAELSDQELERQIQEKIKELEAYDEET